MGNDIVRLGLLDSGADFSIKYLQEIHLFGQTFHLTTTHVGLLVISIVLIVLAVMVNRKISKSNPEQKGFKSQQMLQAKFRLLYRVLYRSPLLLHLYS